MKAASIVFYFFFVSSLLWAQDEMTNKIMGKWKEVGRRCDEKGNCEVEAWDHSFLEFYSEKEVKVDDQYVFYYKFFSYDYLEIFQDQNLKVLEMSGEINFLNNDTIIFDQRKYVRVNKVHFKKKDSDKAR